jgi:hypothetical protein
MGQNVDISFEALLIDPWVYLPVIWRGVWVGVRRG